MGKGNKLVRLNPMEEKLIRFCRQQGLTPEMVLQSIIFDYQEVIKRVRRAEVNETIAREVNKWATLVHEAYRLAEEFKGGEKRDE